MEGFEPNIERTGADYDFSFLDNYINNITRPTKSNPDEVETDDDFYKMEEDDTPDTENELQENPPPTDQQPLSDEDQFMIDLMNGEDHNPMVSDFLASQPGDDDVEDTPTPTAGSTGNAGNAQFKQGVSSEGLTDRAKTVISGLTERIGKFTVTSGKRSASANSSVGGVKKSYHLTGDAVDIRPSAETNKFFTSVAGKKFIQSEGYQIIDERGKKGAAHWHLEPSGTGQKQAGGTGRAIIPLKSTNINTTGYLDGSPTANNPYNIIPGGNITMEGVSRPIIATPIKKGRRGQSIVMQPGENHVFDADYVHETPGIHQPFRKKYQAGGVKR